ncbi:protein polybromo-1-like isoform X3 [Homarus americanus]|uniref:protein polybromo-1-like isoform X3 n=2 Tax=Homarus americanus TaxID=6706 RepID=UPI001C481AB3|nr:protein polybromo-1-like isoform X3 [Homarus americanus]
MSSQPGNKVGMPKRKRQEGDEGGGVMSTPVVEGRPKRRRNDTTLVDTIQYIFDALRNKKKDDDTYLCEAFLRVPRKKTEPQYYDMIKIPIDMLKIQQKIKTDVYNELEEFCKDVQLLVDNAKLYYAKSTEEYKDACELWAIFMVAKDRAPEEINKEKIRQQQLEEEERHGKRRGRPPKTALAMSAPMILEEDGVPMTMEDAVEELFGAVMTAMDPEGRLYSYDFRFLPSRAKYPDYYQLIDHPIDLKTIAQRIVAKQYKNVDDVEDDFVLLFNNACAFNEPGSRIFKDARTLKKLAQLRKGDLLQILNAKKSVRLRSKRSVNNKQWSVLMAELEEGMELPLPEEDSGGTEMPLGTTHDDEESDEDVDPDNPQWQLFLAAKNLSAPNDVNGYHQQKLISFIVDSNYQLVEPFKRLPNRRWHADYYIEIKNPISMSQIRKKIVKGEYRFISEMLDDFNLMFDNAQQYNRPDSRIYRDAVKLQKYIQNKAEEIMSIDEEDSDSYSDDDDSQSHSRRRLGRPPRPLTFKRRAKILFKTLMDYMTDDGRQPIVAFIEKPAKRDYPDYYEVITQPIDMETIEGKIKGDRYSSEEELIGDFKLMFHNCQKYNEEGSVIYTDATILEKVLNEKIKELNQGDGSVVKGKVFKRTKFNSYVCNSKTIKLLYNAVREYRDAEGRQLSEVFLKLPSKALYPDYYEVIKLPIDLERILHKWKNGMYITLDDIMGDLTLMFQNACRYNEPDSQIYRDALSLQRHALEKRLELSSSEAVPNVSALVQELFMSLFISVFNHEEEDGRYTAESFFELPDYEEVDGKKSRVLSFDIMKRRLDKNMYSRLDHFQEDLFSIFERARRCSKVDSRVFLDSITLQTEYMRLRDELCNNGAILQSKALSYTEVELNNQLELMRNRRGLEQEGEDEDSKPPPQPTDGTNNSSLSHNEVQYFVGDFVYLSPPEKNCDYPILHIERLWTNSEGRQMVYGCNYYRPAETFHQPNRKFFEQEVFKTDQHHAYPLTEVIGKCYVLPLVDYIKMKPEGVDEKDLFVCESRYNSRNRFFKKIKSFPFNVGERVKLLERPEPLEMKRVDSVFKERIERHKEELAELDEETKVIRRQLPNVVKSQAEGVPGGHTYYEQYNISSGAVKLGDYVHVKGRDSGKKSVRQICQLWVTPEGTAYFLGTVFKNAAQNNPTGEHLFYKQEVYLTAGVETLPISDITGRCIVFDVKEYCTLRSTEIRETEVYICDSFLDEMIQRVSSLMTGLRKFKHSNYVTQDEIYYFRKPLILQKFDPSISFLKKQPQTYESSPMTPRMDMDYEDSMDGPPPSVASVDSGIIAGTPKSVKKPPTGKQFQQMTGKKQMTGYILFAAEIRKSITLKNPSANFGEISRLVGIEWKRLTETDRKTHEDRAHQMNLESAERALSGNGPDSPQTPQSTPHQVTTPDLPLPNNPDVVFECMWESCDYMFEDLLDLSDHLILEATGHVHKVTQVFECGWRGCSRHKKSSLAPFPMVQRLVRHVREVHIQKNTGRIIQHHDRSRNFVASSRRSLLTVQQPTPGGTPASGLYPTTGSPHSTIHGLLQGRGSPYLAGMVVSPHSGLIPSSQMGNLSYSIGTGVNGSPVPPRTFDPVFVAPPPKTQRLLHSEAYIKYIENLDKPFLSNWERHLMATQENTVINDSGRLPAQWLANGPGSHGTVVNALWALREYMMKDSLGIAKIL